MLRVGRPTLVWCWCWWQRGCGCIRCVLVDQRWCGGGWWTDDDGYGRVALCDRFINAAEMLLSMLGEHVDFTVPVADIGDPAKARELRDRLVHEDRLRLARVACVRCRVDDVRMSCVARLVCVCVCVSV